MIGGSEIHGVRNNELLRAYYLNQDERMNYIPLYPKDNAPNSPGRFISPHEIVDHTVDIPPKWRRIIRDYIPTSRHQSARGKQKREMFLR